MFIYLIFKQTQSALSGTDGELVSHSLSQQPRLTGSLSVSRHQAFINNRDDLPCDMGPNVCLARRRSGTGCSPVTGETPPLCPCSVGEGGAKTFEASCSTFSLTCFRFGRKVVSNLCKAVIQGGNSLKPTHGVTVRRIDVQISQSHNRESFKQLTSDSFSQAQSLRRADWGAGPCRHGPAHLTPSQAEFSRLPLPPPGSV